MSLEEPAHPAELLGRVADQLVAAAVDRRRRRSRRRRPGAAGSAAEDPIFVVEVVEERQWAAVGGVEVVVAARVEEPLDARDHLGRQRRRRLGVRGGRSSGSGVLAEAERDVLKDALEEGGDARDERRRVVPPAKQRADDAVQHAVDRRRVLRELRAVELQELAEEAVEGVKVVRRVDGGAEERLVRGEVVGAHGSDGT